MKTQTRREFLGRLGWMAVGGILIPYIPKTFYSIPGPVQDWLYVDDLTLHKYIIREWARKIDEELILNGTGEKQNLGTISIGGLTQ